MLEITQFQVRLTITLHQKLSTSSNIMLGFWRLNRRLGPNNYIQIIKIPTASPVGCNKRSALHRMSREHAAQCPLVIAPYAG